MRRTSVVVASLAASTLVASWGAVPPAAAATRSSGYRVSVVASHLDNPRGLAVHARAVYVAESGHGSSSHCADIPGQGTSASVSPVPSRASPGTSPTAKTYVSRSP